MLTTAEVASNQTVTITASYSIGDITMTATQPITIIDLPPVLTGLTINGTGLLDENTSASYTATATFDDDSTQIVTDSCTWSENSPYVGISSSGELMTTEVTTDQTVIITAIYNFGDVTITATKQLTVIDLPPVMTELSVNGADSVDENSSAFYTATVTFDDGSTQNVTDSCIWSLDSAYANIDSTGVLTTSEISTAQTVVITASYTFEALTETTTKQITIVDATANNLPPHMPVITNPYDGQTQFDLLTPITTEPFSDPDEGDFHSQSRWQISTQENFLSTTSAVFGDVPQAQYTGTGQDTYVNSGSPTNNNSTNSSLKTYTWPTDTAANRPIIKWDLSVIPPNATIKDATLSLYMYGYSGSGGDDNYEISAHKIVNHDPIISSCTWNTFDGVSSWTGGADGGTQDLAEPEATTVVDKTVGYKNWNITQMVQEWISQPATNFGLLLDSDTSAANDSNRLFSSTEHSDPAQRPKLTIIHRAF
jgi:hypothetical protein